MKTTTAALALLVLAGCAGAKGPAQHDNEALASAYFEGPSGSLMVTCPYGAKPRYPGVCQADNGAAVVASMGVPGGWYCEVDSQGGGRVTAALECE
jgi:hypothetical protein